MRLFLLGTAVALVFGQDPAPAGAPGGSEEKARIEGRVINSATRAPLRKARITVVGFPAPAANVAPGNRTAVAPPAMRQYLAVSDAEGRFVAQGIEPGRYSVRAERDGFLLGFDALKAQGPPKNHVLTAGARLTGIEIALTPLAIITGRVLDEDGDPLRNVQISAMLWAYQQGQRRLNPRATQVTNDNGEYRIFDLPPGRYLLRAVPPRRTMNPQAGQALDESYAPVFFPNAPNQPAAARIDVAPGAELREMNFRLSKARTFRITGKIIAPDGSSAARAFVQIIEDNRGFGSSADQRGIFTHGGLPPGAYTLVAQVLESERYEARASSAPVIVEITNSDIEVELRTMPLFEIAGKIFIKGARPPGMPMSLNIEPEHQTGMGPGPSVSQEDGVVTLKNLAPGRYRLRPGFGFFQSLRLGDREVSDGWLDFRSGPSGPLEMMISYEYAEVSGRVEDSSGEPAAGARVTFASRDSWRVAGLTSFADADGQFKLRQAPPGEYKVFAWEEIEQGADQDPDFLKLFERHASTVVVSEKSKQNITVKLIPRSVIEAEKSKLP